MKKLLALLALVAALAPLSVAAQNLTNHAVAVGRGLNVSGFTAVTIGTAGRVLIDKGAGADPAFTALSGDVSSVTGPGVVTLDPELHCFAGLTSAADKIVYYTGSGTCAVTDLSSGERTFLTTPSSANLRSVLTDEVGTGAAYFVGGALGTPASATLTNATGLPISGITGLGTGVGTALAVNTGSAGAPVLFNGAGGTPSSIALTNGTGLPVAGITSSTSTPLGVGSLEVGNASDTTIARGAAGRITVEGVNVPTISSTDTLTNKSLTSPVVTGTADVQQALALSGDISPTQITADQNDYAPTGFSTSAVLRLDLDADHSITGIAGGSDGLVKIVHNISTNVLTLVNQSVSSTAANRLLLGGDVTLNPDTSITLQYDSTSSRWRAITSPGAGGGGGGGVSSVTVAAGTGISTSGTCTITTSGTCTVALSDQQRQNIALNCAGLAKALAAYQREIGRFCDGYKGSDGINAGSSSGYTINTTTGYVGTVGGTLVTTFLTSGTTFAVPSDWNSSNNAIEVIGGGGGGGRGTGASRGGGGGGGGAYSLASNVSLTASTNVTYAIGSAGAGSTTTSAGGTGGDTYFCNSTSNCASISGTAVVAGAKGGTGGVTPGTATASGGASASGVGGTKYSGGTGGSTTGGATAGGGGGGSAGPGGAGCDGGSFSSGSFAGGGGGAGGGSCTAGNTGSTGNGGNGPTGTAGGTGANPGNPGSNGSGGGGSGSGSAGGGAGGSGTEWDATHGAGGGGGGGSFSGSAGPGGASGTYGGGGGGGGAGTSGINGTGGAGGAGLIVVKYTPAISSLVGVTTSQTADGTITNGRVLIEVDPVDAITINTDLTAEVTCDGGSHWTSTTLSSAGLGQGGHTVYESDDATCGTSGTSFAARLKSFNSKRVNIYRTVITAH